LKKPKIISENRREVPEKPRETKDIILGKKVKTKEKYYSC
jgi:hypothetical protein